MPETDAGQKQRNGDVSDRKRWLLSVRPISAPDQQSALRRISDLLP